MPDQNKSVINGSFEQEILNSYSAYALSVVVSRAITDIRDGLKPVHRRILYSMYSNGFIPSSPRTKSARTVGDCMAKFHPHGDTSLYDSMVRMTQPWSMRVPLVDGEGNFGSQDGDSPAAMRYTESRLARAGAELIGGNELKAVPFTQNYDETTLEPTVFAAPWPNLAINGTDGIAVGVASKIPPHNPTEILDACIALIKNKKISSQELKDIVKGPDFPTGGLIVGRTEEDNLIDNPSATYYLRSKWHIEEGQKNNAIVLTEIPYQTTQHGIVESIEKLKTDPENENSVLGLLDVKNESDRNGLRIVITITKESDIEYILQSIWENSTAQITYHCNTNVLVDGFVKEVTLRTILETWIEWRRKILTETKIREIRNLRKETHLALGRWLASTKIQDIIAILENSESPAKAKQDLMSLEFKEEDPLFQNYWKISSDRKNKTQIYSLTAIQVDSILEMPLRRVAQFAKKEAENTAQKAIETITNLKEILTNKEIQEQQIIESIENQKTRIGDERRSLITQYPAFIKRKHTYQHTKRLLTLDENGWARGIIIPDLKEKERKQAVRNISGKQNNAEYPQYPVSVVAYDDEDILIFTDENKVYTRQAGEWPGLGVSGLGRPISSLFPEDGLSGKITHIVPFSQKEIETHKIILIDDIGHILSLETKTEITKIKSGKKAWGKNFGNLRCAFLKKDEEDIVIAMENGTLLRLDGDFIKNRKSTSSSGLLKIKITANIMSACPVKQEDDLIAISPSGQIVKLNTSQFRGIKGRGTGINAGPKPYTQNLNRLGPEDNNVLIITKKLGAISINIEELKTLKGKSGHGVSLLKTGSVLLSQTYKNTTTE